MAQFQNISCGRSSRALCCPWWNACVIAVLFAVLLLGLAVPVHAGCGDYVFFRDANGRLVRNSTPMVHLPEALQMTRHGYSQPIRLPCTGPTCSERPAAPASPSLQDLRTPLKYALPNTICDDSVLLFFRDRLAATQLMELHASLSIFRPPR